VGFLHFRTWITVSTDVLSLGLYEITTSAVLLHPSKVHNNPNAIAIRSMSHLFAEDFSPQGGNHSTEHIVSDNDCPEHQNGIHLAVLDFERLACTLLS
jgi:hypothetical protein